MTVSITYNTALISDGSEKVVIKVANPYSFISTNNVTLLTSEKFTVDIALGSGIEESAASEAAGSGAKFGMVISFVVTSTANLVLGASMEKMWNLINTCQLIFYMGLVTVYFPNQILSFFSYLKMANMDNEFLAKATEVSLVRGEEDDRQALNYRYSYLGYETISFIENASDLVALCFLIVLSTV